MEMLAVKIDGFRNLKAVEITLSDLSALIALNNYGKSNVMEAIDFATDFISASKEGKRQMMAFKPGMPYNRNHHPATFSIQFKLELTAGNESYLAEYDFAFAWISRDEKSKIIAESLKIKPNNVSQKFTTMFKRGDSGSYYRTSKTGRCSNKLSVDDDELMLNKLQAYDELYYHELLNDLNGLEAYVDHHPDASSSNGPDPIIRRDFNELDLNTLRNIPRILFFLKKEYPDKYGRLEYAYTQLFPHIKEIKIVELSLDLSIHEGVSETEYTIPDKIYMMEFRDENLLGPLSFEQLSDGAKSVFMMLTRSVIADVRHIPFITFEEPENYVHPSMLQSLLRIIKQLVGDKCKILIASHSPHLVSYLDPREIYVGIPNDEDIAKFNKISKPSKLLKDSEMFECSMGDLLFDLMSSGDNEALLKYLEK